MAFIIELALPLLIWLIVLTRGVSQTFVAVLWKFLSFFLPIYSRSTVRGGRSATPGLSVSYQDTLHHPRTRSSTPQPEQLNRARRRGAIPIAEHPGFDRDFSSQRHSPTPPRWSLSPSPQIESEDPYFYLLCEPDPASVEDDDEHEVSFQLLGGQAPYGVLDQQEKEYAAQVLAENINNFGDLKGDIGLVTFSLGLGKKLLDLALPARRLISLRHIKDLLAAGWTFGSTNTTGPQSQGGNVERTFSMRLALKGTGSTIDNNKVALGFRTFLFDTLLPQMAQNVDVDLTIKEEDGFHYDHCWLHPWAGKIHLEESQTRYFVLDGPAHYLGEILFFAPRMWAQKITNLQVLHNNIPVSTLITILESFPQLDNLIVDRISDIPDEELESLLERKKSLRAPSTLFIASALPIWPVLALFEGDFHGRHIRVDLSSARRIGNLNFMQNAAPQFTGLDLILPQNVLPTNFVIALEKVGWTGAPRVEDHRVVLGAKQSNNINCVRHGRVRR